MRVKPAILDAFVLERADHEQGDKAHQGANQERLAGAVREIQLIVKKPSSSCQDGDHRGLHAPRPR